MWAYKRIQENDGFVSRRLTMHALHAVRAIEGSSFFTHYTSFNNVIIWRVLTKDGIAKVLPYNGPYKPMCYT